MSNLQSAKRAILLKNSEKSALEFIRAQLGQEVTLGQSLAQYENEMIKQFQRRPEKRGSSRTSGKSTETKMGTRRSVREKNFPQFSKR